MREAHINMGKIDFATPAIILQEAYLELAALLGFSRHVEHEEVVKKLKELIKEQDHE